MSPFLTFHLSTPILRRYTPDLQVIVDFFAPNRHVRTTWDAFLHANRPVVLHMIVIFGQKLDTFSVGTTQSAHLPHILRQGLARRCVSELSKIEYHDPWAGACVLHAG